MSMVTCDMSIAGGAHTVNQYLAAGLVDELRPHVAPIVLGRGERLLDGVGALGLEQLARSAAPISSRTCATGSRASQ